MGVVPNGRDSSGRDTRTKYAHVGQFLVETETEAQLP